MVDTGKGPTEQGLPTGGQPEEEATDSLYFFPDQAVSEARVRWVLHNGSRDERAWVISHLLRFALWDDIWGYVSREEVRDLFPHVEMPEDLRAGWARMLKIEQKVEVVG